jgi:hypothetical protein
MKKKSLDEYKMDIKILFDEARKNDISGLLETPSPGNLKKLCIIKAGITVNSDDREIFKRFFEIAHDDIIKQIEVSDADKLRPATNFLRGKTNDTQQIVAELLAILLDFSPRPYKKYANLSEQYAGGEDAEIQENEEGKKDPINILIIPPDEARANTLLSDTKERQAGISKNDEGKKSQVKTKSYQNNTKKWKLYVAIVSILIVIIMSITFFYKENNCLTWQVDHYELVDCDGNYPIVSYDEDLLKFKKLEVSDTTTFFKDGEPIVWYSKQNNTYEYFNSDGKNPVTGKELKPVSTYIVQTQVKNKE